MKLQEDFSLDILIDLMYGILRGSGLILFCKMPNVFDDKIPVPLDLEGIRIVRYEVDERGDYLLYAESTATFEICHKCNRIITYKHGLDKPITVRHLDILGHRVFIIVCPIRFRCFWCDDNPTTTQNFPWRAGKSPYTKDFERHILKQLINSTVEDVSKKEGIGYYSVLGILNRCISSDINWNEFVDIKILGLDEIALRKGHKDFVTVVSAIDVKGQLKIMAVLAGRDEDTVSEFLRTTPEEVKVEIKSACIDMCRAYRNSVEKELPNARVVVDRFHVAKAYRQCFDTLRKRESARLKKELPDEKQGDIKNTMWPLRKRSGCLDDDERNSIEAFFEHSKDLREAYRFREDLTDIFDSDITVEEARKRIDNWKEDVKDAGVTCYDSFLTTLNNWEPYILNYFEAGLSSGFVEGLNNKAKVLKRRCYGLRNIVSFFKRFVLDVNWAPGLMHKARL